MLLVAGQVIGDECDMLNFERAWELVSAYSPGIGAVDAEVAIRYAERDQLSLIPNPVATIESENLGVFRRRDCDVEPPETTFALSQLVELGGKRFWRADVASAVADIACYDAQIARLNLLLALRVAFIDAALAQEFYKLAEQKAYVAEQTVQAVELQVSCGKASCLQLKKAKLCQTSAEISLKEACADLEMAKKKLSLMWGCCTPDFETIDFDLYGVSEIPCYSFCVDSVVQTPDYARAQALLNSRIRNIRLQVANGIPDVTLTVGFSVYHRSSQHGLLVGVQVPLPIFDRNQGNIQKAYCERTQAEFQMQDIAFDLTEKMTDAHTRLSVAYESLEALKGCSLYEAHETVTFMDAGYESGKVEYLELLDAHKIYFEVQENYLRILNDYHKNRAGLDRLTGGCL